MDLHINDVHFLPFNREGDKLTYKLFFKTNDSRKWNCPELTDPSFIRVEGFCSGLGTVLDVCPSRGEWV
jgi:hypothetical protein